MADEINGRKCSRCGEIVRGNHYCRVAQREIDYDDSDFMMSFVIGAVTNNWVLGAFMGGSITGGLLGDIVNDGCLMECPTSSSSTDDANPTPSYDSESSSNVGSSYDTGSSTPNDVPCDSGSSSDGGGSFDSGSGSCDS